MRAVRTIAITALMLATQVPAGQGAPGHAVADTAGYRVVARIAPGGEGGWDYLTLDAAGHRLFVTRATRVQVVDLERGALIGEIPNTGGVHGVALAPDLGRGFTSNGRDTTVTIFDLRSLATLSTVRIPGLVPDAIAYDSVSHRVFTFNGRSDDATALEAATGAVVGTVALGGKPEFAVADGRGRMFVNLEDQNALVGFDTRTLEVRSRWPLAPGTEPTGLAIDRDRRRLFAGCNNQRLIALDADSGRVVADLPIGAVVDGVAFDHATRLIFSSNGDGTLTIVREDSADRFTTLGSVPTQRGARTLALDERTHRVYLATAQFGETPPATPEQPHPRPPLVPGSFVILVLGPGAPPGR